MTEYRTDLPPRPPYVALLPLDERGYPVPWFASFMDGKPELRFADGRKLVRAVQDSLCWVCGEQLGTFRAFILGPMCTVNCVSAEPPMHRACGLWRPSSLPSRGKTRLQPGCRCVRSSSG